MIWPFLLLFAGLVCLVGCSFRFIPALRVNLSVAYHEVYDIDAKCEVLQVDFIPVIKFFEDAQRAPNAR